MKKTKTKGHYDSKLGVWIPQRILDLDDLSPTEKIILSMIRHYDLKSQSGGCFVSNDHVADKVNVRVNTVQRSLNKLARAGYIARTSRLRSTRYLIYLFFIPEEGDADTGKFDSIGRRIIDLPKGFNVIKESKPKEKPPKPPMAQPVESPTTAVNATESPLRNITTIHTPSDAKERIARLSSLIVDARRECEELFNDGDVASDAELKCLLSSISEQFKDDVVTESGNVNSLSFSQSSRNLFLCPQSKHHTDCVASDIEAVADDVENAKNRIGEDAENNRDYWRADSVVNYDGSAENHGFTQGNMDERPYFNTFAPSMNMDERPYFDGVSSSQKVDERPYFDGSKSERKGIEICVDEDENVEKITFLSTTKLKEIHNFVDFFPLFPTVLIKVLKKDKYKKNIKKKNGGNNDESFHKPERQIISEPAEDKRLSQSPVGDSSYLFFNSISNASLMNHDDNSQDATDIENDKADKTENSNVKVETEPSQQKTVFDDESSGDDGANNSIKRNVPPDLTRQDSSDKGARKAEQALFILDETDESNGNNDAKASAEAVSLPKNERLPKDSVTTPKTDKAPQKRTKRGSSLSADGFMKELPENYRNPAMRQIISDYLQMRIDIKKPMTASALRYTLPKFKDCKPEVFAACVLRSIQNSWQGIFLPKSDDYESALHDDIEMYRQIVKDTKLPETAEERAIREKAERERQRAREEMHAKMERDKEEGFKRFLQKADEAIAKTERKVKHRKKHHDIRQALIKSSLAEQGIEYEGAAKTIIPVGVPFKFHFTPNVMEEIGTVELYEQLACDLEQTALTEEAIKIEMAQRKREAVEQGLPEPTDEEVALSSAEKYRIRGFLSSMGNRIRGSSDSAAHTHSSFQNREFVKFLEDNFMQGKVFITVPEMCREVVSLERVEKYWEDRVIMTKNIYLLENPGQATSSQMKNLHDLAANHIPDYEA